MNRTISHYEILGKIGEGGMGVVYKARDVRLGRVVALKFLPARLADSDVFAGRFEDEARAISALNHPHIATIFELDAEGPDHFLALELLPGGTLSSLLKRRKAAGELLPFDTILEYAWQIAEGLAHAHSHGIVHRDVKADNVMLTAEGTLKITDFGLAKLRDGGGRTAAGQAVGTAAYMSPEQASGKEVDQRTDIFSFGVLLHNLATLELPFGGPSVLAIMQEVYSKDAPRIAQIRTDLPPEFQRIVDKALAKDRDERYQNMEEVLSGLQAVSGGRISMRVISRVTGESPTLTMVSPLAAGWRQRTKKRRAFLWAGAAVLAAGLIGGGVLWNRRFRLNAERHIAVLPFTNIGGDRETQALCDGLVETLTSSLGQLQRFGDTLWVVPSGEIRQQPVSNAAAAHQVFGATLVVTGSLQRDGDRLRLTASLCASDKSGSNAIAF